MKLTLLIAIKLCVLICFEACCVSVYPPAPKGVKPKIIEAVSGEGNRAKVKVWPPDSLSLKIIEPQVTDRQLKLQWMSVQAIHFMLFGSFPFLPPPSPSTLCNHPPPLPVARHVPLHSKSLWKHMARAFDVWTGQIIKIH